MKWCISKGILCCLEYVCAYWCAVCELGKLIWIGGQESELW